MARLFLRLEDPLFQLTGSAVCGKIGIEQNPIFPFRDPQSVTRARSTGKIDDDRHTVAQSVSSHIGKHISVCIVHGEPFKPVPGILYLVESGRFTVKTIEHRVHDRKLVMQRIFVQEKFQSFAIVPFFELPELAAHKQEFFPGV